MTLFIVLQVKSLFFLQKFLASMSLRAERSNLIKYLRDCFVASLLAMTCLYCSLLRYVITLFGPLYAFNSDGSIKWTYGTKINNWTDSPTIGLDGTIYFSDSNGILYAVNHDGTLKWSNNEKEGQNPLPFFSIAISPDGNTLYLPALDKTLNAFDAQSGLLKWEIPTGHQLVTTPLVDSDGNIYFVNLDSTGFRMRSVCPDGTVRWTSDQEIFYNVNFHMDGDGNLYAIGKDKNMLSFDYQGKLRWMAPYLGDVWKNTIIGDNDGVIYFAFGYGQVHSFDQDDKLQFVWTLSGLPDWLEIGAISADSRLYSSGRYQFYCIE